MGLLSSITLMWPSLVARNYPRGWEPGNERGVWGGMHPLERGWVGVCGEEYPHAHHLMSCKNL